MHATNRNIWLSNNMPGTLWDAGIKCTASNLDPVPILRVCNQTTQASYYVNSQGWQVPWWRRTGGGMFQELWPGHGKGVYELLAEVWCDQRAECWGDWWLWRGARAGSSEGPGHQDVLSYKEEFWFIPNTAGSRHHALGRNRPELVCFFKVSLGVGTEIRGGWGWRHEDGLGEWWGPWTSVTASIEPRVHPPPSSSCTEWRVCIYIVWSNFFGIFYFTNFPPFSNFNYLLHPFVLHVFW